MSRPRPHWWPHFARLAAALVVALIASGCGSGGSDQSFTDCGNGRRDTDEACDDNNMDDHDACTTACQPARCGDGVAFSGVEDCDDLDMGGGTCAPRGLTGVPVCDAACRYDYSTCGPPPTATLPPTATSTVAPPTPTPTATPASSCGDGLLSRDETCTTCPEECTPEPCTTGADSAAVSVSLTVPPGEQTGQIRVQLAYRTSTVSLPNSNPDLLDRFTVGPTQPNVRPSDLDYAVDVQAARTAGLSGLLFTISFDRCAGAAPPTGSDFACTVTLCRGATSGCTCSVDVP